MHSHSSIRALVWATALLVGAPASAEPVARGFFDLTRYAASDSLAVTGGMLWAGVEGYGSADSPGQHRLYVFDADDAAGGKPAEILLGHAPLFIYPYGPASVLVTGLSVDQASGYFRSHYSVVSWSGSDARGSLPAAFKVEQHDFPSGSPAFPGSIFVNQFAALGGRAFFSLRYGENAVMEWRIGGAPRKLAPRITMPAEMIALSGSLFVHERDFVDNVVKVDLATQAATRLFADAERKPVSRIAHWPAAGTVVVATPGEVLLSRLVTLAVTQRLAIDGLPNGLAPYGRCLLVLTEDTRTLDYLLMRDGVAESVARLDLSGLGGKFEMPRNIVGHEESQRIYVRATRACPGCAHSPNSLAVIEDKDGGTARLCGL